MKILLIGINAKYIHPNLAIRLLKKNTSYPVDIKEYTIKDDINAIISHIIDYDVVAFSCYIWNIEVIKKILNEIKDKKLIKILGGPEVSYNAKYYLNNNLANYVIKNEGEEAFDLLLNYLDKKNIDINKIPNLYYKNTFTYDKIVDISNTKMAYDLLDDVNNKIMYIETSRGCPYHCGYCMASLDNKVRFFDMEEIKKQILILQNKGAKIFKFLDRTFNANKKFLDLIDFIIENHHKNESYQFEITGDLLKPEYIDYINCRAPKNLFRFEIGIQSTNIKSNLSVGRIQNNDLLFSNIKRIQDAGIIDLHLDLIAGLPYEDYSTFQKTFNDVLALRPKELQLGFLKILYGTNLYKEADMYSYKWNNNAPYEIISNNFLSEADINNIHRVEDAFEKYYNSGIMKNSMNYILDKEENHFNLFFELSNLDYNGPLEKMFLCLDLFLKEKTYYQEIHKIIIKDYLNHFNLKPKAWWKEKCDKKEKNIILRNLKENNILKFELNILYKYSLLVNLEKYYLIAIYQPNKKDILTIEKP
ncbi:MAG: DUF4080 domain-containing protein [Anaeroplasma sp.]